MSTKKPNFQALSPSISKRIVHYYLQSKETTQQQESQPFQANVSKATLLAPLFSVCNSIRSVAQECAFETCKIDIETEQNDLTIKVNEQPWTNANDDKVSAKMFELAKAVEIDISCTGIIDGSILKKLQQKPFDIIRFSNAHSLKVTLLGEDIYKSLGNDELLENNVKEFVEYLKSLFSVLTRVDVLHVGYITINDQVKDNLTTMLAALLYEGAESIGISHSAPIVSLLKYPGFGKHLLGLYCNIGSHAEEFIKVIQQNADTLVSLKIVTSLGICGIDLVKDSDGNPVIYRNLKHLYHTQFYDASPEKTNIAREIAPFPCLEDLCLFGAHPFTDDTVFRNNEKTLRRITMDMDNVGARVINQYETFADHRYKNLKRVKIILAAGRRSDSLPYDGLAKAAVAVASCSQSLTLDSSMLAVSKNVAQDICNTNCSQQLQSLDITGTRFTLPEMLSLLKQLAALRKLYCEPDGLGTTKNKNYKKSKDQHLAKAVAEVEIQNKCLQYWKIDSIKSHAVSTVATMVILVALSCPMFQYADVPKRIVPIYNAFILKAIAEEPLASHAERLKSLVIHDDE
ncbi:hypothetical protein FB645_001100 [Coemansia sp. IMI 203386]|nr:hypothetical protein FB645_001100 [Coemansia sp. IMI 203386]